MVNPKAGRGQASTPESTPFDRVLIEAVSDGLKAVLGEPAATAIFYHLERNCFLKMERIPEKPADFAAELENIFGEGASLIETRIVEDLYSKLGLEHRRIKDCGFADYVKHAKEKLESDLNSGGLNWRRTKILNL